MLKKKENAWPLQDDDNGPNGYLCVSENGVYQHISQTKLMISIEIAGTLLSKKPMVDSIPNTELFVAKYGVFSDVKLGCCPR